MTAKHVAFACTNKALDVKLADIPLVSGTFFLPVTPDDSSWEMDTAKDGTKLLRIELAKARPNVQWDCLFMSEIDDSITQRVFFDLSIGGVEIGRVIFGLHGKACPKTAENFRCLCTGEKGSVKLSKRSTIRLHYEKTRLHRVVPGFLVQGGDVTHSEGGTGGYSIYGPTFCDESFKIKHTGAGQLLMANFGLFDANHSQFAVAMGRITEFESNYVIFGAVQSGMDVLRRVELEGSGEGFTAHEVLIERCGELDERGEPIEELGRE